MNLATLFPIALLFPLSSQETTPQPVPTKIYVAVDDPMLVEIDIEAEFGPLSGEMSIAFVDQHTEIGEGVEVGFRHYLRTHVDMNGEVQDPPLCGQRVLIEARGEDVIASSIQGHWLPGSELTDALDRDYPSLGLYLRFPESLTVGDSFELSLSHLANLIVDLGKTQEAQARLRLDAYDLANQRATYSGTGTILQVDEGITFTSELELDLVVHLGAGHIETLDAQGAMTSAIVQGSFEFALKAERGPKAKKALTRKPRFRKRIYDYKPLGFRMEIPSNWGEDEEQDGFELRPVNARYNDAAIQIQMRTESSRNPKAFLDATEAGLEDSPGFKSENVSCKLGKGRAFLLDGSTEDGEPLRLRVELYPYKNTWLQCRYFARPKTFKKYEKDYKKAIKSLKLTD